MSGVTEATRTFSLRLIPGLEDEDVDVTVFAPSLTFISDDGTPKSDFVLSTTAWEAMGKPRRIEVTVRPA